VRIELRFLAHSLARRNFEVRAGDRLVYDSPLPAGRKVISLRDLEVLPGESQVTFSTSGPTTKSDDFTPGQVLFKIERARVLVRDNSVGTAEER
jgi:hypothetical protein